MNWIVINGYSLFGPYWNNEGKLVLYIDKSIPVDYAGIIYATECGALYPNPINGTNYVFKDREFIEIIIYD